MKILIMLCIIAGANAFAGDSGLKTQLDGIFAHSGLKKSDVALYVVGNSGNTIYSLNGQKNMIPASITKLITTAAVMNAFPSATKFHTQIYLDGVQTGSTFKGDIYLKGLGDPAFVSEKMWMIVNEFTRTGIKEITGNIVADDSYFDDERFDEGRESERNDRAYDAPVGALSFNWNSTTIYVRPGKNPGDQARVFIDPPNSFVVLVNKVTTSSKGTDLQAQRTESEGHDTVTVQGKIALSSEEKHIYKDISNPPLYAAANFREFLKQRGIEVQGGTKIGVTPKLAILATDFEGEPLYRLLNDMNKFSNNYIAEMLVKNLAAFKTGKQGKMADGVREVRNFLKNELHWPEEAFNLVNVSGFTRKNSFSPQQFVSVLTYLRKQFNMYPEFIQSLPISGVDGTLQKRMKDSSTGWVRAKTGLLNGVVALSGYAGGHDGSVNTFAFIYNGSGKEAHVREVFDSMASTLVTE